MDNELSLLWPNLAGEYRGKCFRISSETINDLNVEGLCKEVCEEASEIEYIKGILTELCSDENVVRYRQEIFEDIYSSKEISRFFSDLFPKLDYMNITAKEVRLLSEVDLWKFFLRLKELNTYIDCVVDIKAALSKVEVKSEGLIKLREIANKLASEEVFQQLCDDVKVINESVGMIKSMNLGMNLDSSFNPVDITLLSFSSKRIKHTYFLQNITEMNKDQKLMTRIKKSSKNNRHIIMNFIRKDIDDALRSIIHQLKKILGQYESIDGSFMNKLVPELMFYVKFGKFIRNIEETGLKFCKPDIEMMDKRRTTIESSFNLNFAIHLIEQRINPTKRIILNDVNFGDNGRVLLLTGPNMGGKTVYTTGIGLAQLLYQAGLYVPGDSACMSPVDRLFTHYPVEESQTLDMGRLGEECKRLKEIFDSATKNSMVLLNETLSSTSFTEGKFIAEEVVKSLRYLGIRALFNTHIHELAEHTNVFNSEVEGESKIISLVTGVEEGIRSYKVYEAPPIGKSFAIDIAQKHGLSYRQLIEV